MGFFSPGLGFATGAGAFIGGFAKQANENIERDHNEQRQNDILWMNKFERGLAEYNKEKEKVDQQTAAYNSFLRLSKGDQSLAHDAMLAFMANPKDYMTIYNNLKDKAATEPRDTSGFQSPFPGAFTSQLDERRRNLESMRSQVRPEARQFMNLPGSDYSSSYTGQQQSQPANRPPAPTAGIPQVSPQPAANSTAPPVPSTGDDNSAPVDTATPMPNGFKRAPNGDLINPNVDPNRLQPAASTTTNAATSAPSKGTQVAQGGDTGFRFGNTDKALIRKEFQQKPDDFNTPDGYKRYFKSVTDYPTDPGKWDLSDLRNPVTKWPPEVMSQVVEMNKNLKYMSPEDRKAWQDSVEQARKTGDVTQLRMDLHPSAEQIAQFENSSKAGAENARDYTKALQKRRDGLAIQGKALTASNEMLQMVATGELRANPFQGFMDNLNRAAAVGGIDLRGAGFPANSIQNANQFKKFLSDLTFDQIPNYHLGRWTNREFNVLKESLPSLDTDPSTIAKVALLFRSAAQREMDTTRNEARIAWGENGERFFNPKAEDVGKAFMYGVNTTRDAADKLPWTELSGDDAGRKAFADLPIGAWVERPDIKLMGVKTGDNTVRWMRRT